MTKEHYESLRRVLRASFVVVGGLSDAAHAFLIDAIQKEMEPGHAEFSQFKEVVHFESD